MNPFRLSFYLGNRSRHKTGEKYFAPKRSCVTSSSHRVATLIMTSRLNSNALSIPPPPPPRHCRAARASITIPISINAPPARAVTENQKIELMQVTCFPEKGMSTQVCAHVTQHFVLNLCLGLLINCDGQTFVKMG